MRIKYRVFRDVIYADGKYLWAAEVWDLKQHHCLAISYHESWWEAMNQGEQDVTIFERAYELGLRPRGWLNEFYACICPEHYKPKHFRSRQRWPYEIPLAG